MSGRASPVQVQGLTDAVEIASGDGFDCARLRDGTVRCWGTNESGQLGNGGHGAATIAEPVTVQGLSGVTGLTLLGNTACARLADGSVQCWGVVGHLLGHPLGLENQNPGTN
ncbi:MAG: RCC1 domain-containing protein, partial [Deltaproteobacteria bacterium]